jgi:Xaa-Pro aminopeptidase
VCDFGCVVEGYCSDMTRTVSVGDPGPDARRLYDLVLLSQQAGRDMVASGVDCVEVDRACRDIISDAGYGDAFSHGTGHGVGLEIHEAPRVASTAAGTLLVGDVVTVEPGVYLPGVGGVRIEDTVVVTASGSRPLTHTSKDLML